MPVSANTEIINTQVVYRDGTGVYPAIVHEGGVGGSTRLVVFGMRRTRKGQKGEEIVEDVPATIVNDVPYSSRLSGEGTRKQLFPYWDYS